MKPIYPSRRVQDEGPCPPNSSKMKFGKWDGVVRWRCTCCGHNYPESEFVNTVEGDYCKQCFHSHEYKIIPEPTFVDLTEIKTLHVE